MFSPFGIQPSNHSVWKPEPTYRGTYSILSTCLLTMSLCVWTAVHLNLPEQDKHSRHRWRKLEWLVAGLLTPELVAFTAFEQRREALEMCNDMRRLHELDPLVPFHRKAVNALRGIWRRDDGSDSFSVESIEMRGESPESQDSRYPRTPPWTLVHGFYAIMGGFAMDSSDSKRPFLPGGLRRVVLTPAGIRNLAQKHLQLIPDVSKEEIEDKGKANSLAKALVCWQASWFCITCICRLAQGFPVSLLELNVFAHAICTLLIYLLWWDKPLDVQEPTLIRSKDAHSICALFSVMRGSLGNDALPWQKVELGGLKKLHITLRERLSDGERPEYHGSTDTHPVRPGSTLKLLNGDFHYNLCVFFKEVDDTTEKPYIEIDEVRSRQWMLASEALEKYPSLEDKPREVVYTVYPRGNWRYAFGLQLSGPISSTYEEYESDEYDSYAVKRRLRSGIGSRFSLSPEFMTGLTLAGVIYGGLHLLAWTAPFASFQQRILWRISAVVIASSGPAVLAAVWAAKGLVKLQELDKVPSHIGSISISILMVFYVCLTLLYLFSRTYLVVECFLSIARLPEGVYKLPNWSQYVPHIL